VLLPPVEPLLPDELELLLELVDAVPLLLLEPVDAVPPLLLELVDPVPLLLLELVDAAPLELVALVAPEEVEPELLLDAVSLEQPAPSASTTAAMHRSLNIGNLGAWAWPGQRVRRRRAATRSCHG
jgi:hypothetical protein